jgi:hypothetical protein
MYSKYIASICYHSYLLTYFTGIILRHRFQTAVSHDCNFTRTPHRQSLTHLLKFLLLQAKFSILTLPVSLLRIHHSSPPPISPSLSPTCNHISQMNFPNQQSKTDYTHLKSNFKHKAPQDLEQAQSGMQGYQIMPAHVMQAGLGWISPPSDFGREGLAERRTPQNGGFWWVWWVSSARRLIRYCYR